MAADVGTTGGVDFASALLNSATALVINKPSGLADGDLMYAVIHYSITSGTITPPAGWTQQQGENTNRTFYAYTKPVPLASAESGASDYTWTMTGGSGRLVGAILRVTGADSVAPVNVAGTCAVLGTTNTVAPTVVTTVPNTLLIGAWFACDSTTTVAISPPGSMTQILTQNSSPAATTTIMIAKEQVAAAGGTGTRSASNVPSPSSGVGGMLMAIAPQYVAPDVRPNARVFPSMAATQASIW